MRRESLTVGERPRSCDRSAVARVIANRTLERRGTRTDQPLSRKCR